MSSKRSQGSRGRPTILPPTAACTECGRKRLARNLCMAHYQAWYRAQVIECQLPAHRWASRSQRCTFCRRHRRDVETR